MKRHFRILPLLLALLLLWGCTGPAQPENVDTSEAAQTTAEPAAALSPEEIGAAVDAAPVTEGSHPREEAYLAAFQTHSLALAPFTLHMENRIYEEAALRGCAKALWQDLAAAEQAIGAQPAPLTVYLVSQPLGGGPAALDGQVFLSPEDLESSAGREAILQAAYGLRAPWQAAGLQEYLFGAADEADLKTYYADGNHDLTASCSAIHLSPLLSDPDTVRAARATARSLTAFLMETMGFAGFRETADPGRVLPEWSQRLGLSAPLTLPEKSGAVSGLRLGQKSGTICTLLLDNYTVELYQDSWLLDPDGLYAWFCDFYAGMDLVMEQIRAEAPSAAQLAEEKLAEPIRIVFTDENSTTVTYYLRNEVYLSRPDAIWHEMLHLLLEPSNPELDWMAEAVAEHFRYDATARYAPVRYISDGFEAYLDFFRSADLEHREAEEDDLVFHRSVWNLYNVLKDPALTDYDDLGAYARAYGISSLLLDGTIQRTQVRMKYDRPVDYVPGGQNDTPKETEGNGLSYPQAVAVFEYLAEQQGMDEAVMAYLEGKPTDKAFDISYPDLFTAAVAHYRELYGEHMAK